MWGQTYYPMSSGNFSETFKSGKTSILKFLSVFALVMLLGVSGVMGQVTIASQNFESSPATPTMTISTTNIGSPAVATFSSSTSGGSDAPASSNLFAGGSRGYRISGPSSGSATAGQTLTFSSVNTSGYSSVQVSYRVAGMSIGSNANGMENTVDQVLLEVSPDGGTTWYQQSVLNITGTGFNARWAFSATGTGTRAYVANNTFTTHSVTNNTPGGATLTGANAITTVTVTNLPSVSNLQVRISAQVNAANESWIIDDVIISGTAASAPTKLAITSITPTSPTVGSTFSVTVQSQDGSNVASGVTTSNGVTLSTNGNAGSIGGTTTGTISASGNSVTISGVTLSTTGTGVTLTATQTSGTPSLTAGTSSTFSVLAAASQLAFGASSPPSTGSVNTNLTSFTVEARRPDNTVDNSYTGNVTLTKASGSGNIAGTLTVAAVAGIATFTAVQFDAVGTYTITAASGALTTATSGNVVVSVANTSTTLWNGGSSAWLTAGNWNSGLPSSTRVAQFGTAVQTTVGFNMNGATVAERTVAAIEFVSGASARTINNSSGTVDNNFILSGGVVNGISNVILRNNSSNLMTISDGSSRTLGIALGNATNNIINIDGTGGITVSCIISGSNPLTKAGSGSGVLTLSTGNTYTGKTFLTTGTVSASGESAFGANPASFVADQITFNGGTLSASGNINFNSNRGITFSGTNSTINTNANTVTLTNICTGTNGGYTKTGSGTLILAGAHTYTGSTTVSAGILQLNAAGTFPDASALSLAATTTFDLKGFSETIGSLAGTGGTVSSTVTGNLTLTAGGDNTSTSYSGIIQNGTATSVGLTKAGNGTLTLSGANTYTGATTINVGTLSISSIANGGSNSGIGASTNAAANLVLGGGTLQYTGGTASTDRNFTLTDATTSTIDNTNQLTITGASTATTGALIKTGAGTLILSGTNLHTGGTTISAGILQLNRTGGTTIPITNNVIISGGTLKISTNQTLNDVTLTSGTLMVDAGVTLTINGSFTGGGTIENNGTIVLVGPSNFPGSGTTISAMNNLTISRSGGVTLDQSFTLTGTLAFTSGNLITGTCNAATSNIALTMADDATITGASASSFVDGILKKTGNDAFTFPIGSGAKYAPVSLTAPSVITDRFAVCYTGSNPNSSYSITAKDVSLNNVSKMEYWHINREAGSSALNVTLSWDTIARSGPVRAMSDLRVCRWNGSQWVDLSNTGGTTGSNASGTVTSGSVSSFSPFTLGSTTPANPLPVTWAGFDVKSTEMGNNLIWKTASEKNTDYFEVEYSYDAMNFNSIATHIPAAGNSASVLTYSYLHKDFSSFVYYRIRQVDHDAKYDYSVIKMIKRKNDNTFDVSFYPLPVSVDNEVNLTITSIDKSEVKLRIMNITGQEVFAKSIFPTSDYISEKINISNLMSGVYQLEVMNSHGKKMIKFLK